MSQHPNASPESTPKTNEQTGQTGQEANSPVAEVKKPRKRRAEAIAWIEVSQDPRTRLWNWCLWAQNGRMVAVGVTSQSCKKDAVMAANSAYNAMTKVRTVELVHVRRD